MRGFFAPTLPSSSPRTTCCPAGRPASRGSGVGSSARFDRVVVHSERGREALADLDVDAHRHPASGLPERSGERRDDGRTVLAFGVIRPYKGLGDAIEAVRRAGMRGCSSPAIRSSRWSRYRERPLGLDVEWRLGYLPQAEVDRALGEATVAVFPYRPELDQSGALLRALGAGVPAVAYDVGGVAEPMRALRRGPRRSGRRRRGARRRGARRCSPTGDARAGSRRRAARAGGADVGRGRTRAPRRSTGS